MPRRASISAKIPRIAGVCCGISVVERETSETLSSEAGTPRAESSRRRRACIESASSTPPAPPPTTTSWIGLRSASAAAAVSRSAEDAGSVRPRFQLMVLPRRPTNESAGSLTGGISWGGESPQPASAASATRCRMESQRAQKPSMGLTGVTPLAWRASVAAVVVAESGRGAEPVLIESTSYGMEGRPLRWTSLASGSIPVASAWISRAFANVPSLAKSMWHSSRVYSPAT
mmetsp:Transcript_12669/g.38710  ORF Transcript_12669/g.38710 Transcript_12669/m.38710 type:complete len:231 (-) Transcript_12669:748-1440(-)